MRYRVLTTVLLVFVFSSAFSQQRNKFLLLDFSLDGVSSEDPNHSFIRGDRQEGWSDLDYAQNMENKFKRVSAAVKFELRSKNDKFGFISGIRGNAFRSSKVSTDELRYVYVHYRREGTTTEYLRVTAFEQSTIYLSVPLEVRWLPFEKRKMNLFFAGGAEIGYRLNTTSKISFYDASMSHYDDGVAALFEKPSDTFMSGYTRIGFVVGKERPWLNFGVEMPVVFSSGVSTLVSPTAGGGFFIQLQTSL